MSQPVLQVFVFREGNYVGSELFVEPELVLGSGEGADLVIPDSAVGDAHAILAREGDQLRILDLGHPGGTRVNGSAVQNAPVSPRDELALGRHTLKLKLVRPRKADELPDEPETPRVRTSPRPSPGRAAPAAPPTSDRLVFGRPGPDPRRARHADGPGTEGRR